MAENNRKPRGRIIAAVILIICAVVIILMAVRFVRHRLAYAVTDAVFVRTDSLVSVGFNRVSGRIQSIDKKEGDLVDRDEVLARLDDTSYRLAVTQFMAGLEVIKKERQAKEFFLHRLKKETTLNEEIASSHLEELQRQKEAMMAQVAAIQVDIEQLQRNNNRYQDLLVTQAVSQSQADDTSTRLRARQLAKDALQKQVAALDASKTTALRQLDMAVVKKLRIKETEKELEGLDEKIKEVATALQRARDDLEQCIVKSPLTGRVAKRFVSPGALVSPQKVILSLLDPNNIYIIALLEEQKLAGVESGAPANITIDAYPHTLYEGEVDTIMPASAATFALAPRDISAGEFTKVAQRIPVRIRITKGDVSRLRVGMGGEIEIKRQNKPESGNNIRP